MYDKSTNNIHNTINSHHSNGLSMGSNNIFKGKLKSGYFDTKGIVNNRVKVTKYDKKGNKVSSEEKTALDARFNLSMDTLKKPKRTKKKHRVNKKSNSLIEKSFYKTKEWIRLRYRVLRANDGNCSCCGRNYRIHKVVLHVDHIKPRSKYPSLELDFNNLQILCEDCNLGKGNTDSIDWKKAKEIPSKTKFVAKTNNKWNKLMVSI